MADRPKLPGSEAFWRLHDTIFVQPVPFDVVRSVSTLPESGTLHVVLSREGQTTHLQINQNFDPAKVPGAFARALEVLNNLCRGMTVEQAMWRPRPVHPTRPGIGPIALN